MVENLIFLLLGIVVATLVILFAPKLRKKECKKSLIDKELEIYKREKEYSIDRDIQSRKETNWKDLDEVRIKRYKEEAILKNEIALLQEKKLNLEGQIKTIDNTEKYIEDELRAYKKIIDLALSEKDKEVNRLNDTLTKVIDNFNNVVLQIKHK